METFTPRINVPPQMIERVARDFYIIRTFQGDNLLDDMFPNTSIICGIYKEPFFQAI